MVEGAVPGSISEAERPFRPVRWLPGGHLQTIVPSVLRVPPEPRSRRLVLEVEAASDDRGASSVEVLISETDVRPVRGTVLTVHGLGGSARKGDSRHVVAQALERGWHVARLNLRNCGGTESLASTLYNAGQSDDIGVVLAALEAEELPRPFGVISFSLGASQVLLHASEAGSGIGADAIVAVNPPLSLAAANAAIRRPENVLYHLNYTRSLCKLLDRIRAVREVPGPAPSWWRLRTVRRFDQAYTVPDAGHPDVDTYYAAASSGPHLGRVTAPTLVLSAADDPIVRVEDLEGFEPDRGHAVRFEHPQSGGHCGYWQQGRPRAWAPARALDFLEGVTSR